ncbi:MULTISPECIES: transposase family protein [unclassified Shewanella]|uniref:transposase family protein n=1 Tax=Shewanella TaxID=22 RepID=UPI0021D8737D|nr:MULTISPECIES: transposase family protein [unclassified Shewanella]MCU8023948.1 transposase family protein [Shewanella sp. SM78]MCU8081017.1 transposase family protein [Shewanella sp. SM103]
MTLPVVISAVEQLKINRGIAPNTDTSEAVYVSDQLINEHYLLIHIDIPTNRAFAINLNTTARFPIKLEYDQLLEQINTDQIIVFDNHWPQGLFTDEDCLSASRRKKASNRFSIIKPLVKNLEAVLMNGYGEKLFQQVIDESGSSRQAVYDYFYAYLRMGQRINGLAFPVGKNANSSIGKRVISVKQGRPNSKIEKGKVLNDIDFKHFSTAMGWYVKRNGPSILKVYEDMLGRFYISGRIKNSQLEIDKTGELFCVTLLPANQRPTYDQFYYWLNKQFNGNIPLRDKSRQNAIENKKDSSGRRGDAYVHVIAPGQVFEVDETPFPEELVSVFDPTRSTKIGKATLYFVIDVFSKLIVGLYITTENPSYNTVKQVIFNAATEKQRLFDELDLNLNAEHWSQFGVAQTYFVDKAEFYNKLSEGPITDLPITIKFSRSGRGDDKPNVEQLFHVFQSHFEGVSPAHQTKSQQDIASQIARKKAALTISELYAIAIVYIFYHNNHRVIKNYSMERDMVRDNVAPIPAKLWAWGLANRPGYLLNVPADELHIKLLEKGYVTVHRHGLYLQNKSLWYNCDWTLATGLQERKLANQKNPVLPCRYSRSTADVIFICTEDGLKMASLNIKSSQFRGLSFAEVKIQQEAESKNLARLEEVALPYKLGMQRFVATTIANAQAEKTPGTMTSLSKIKSNRRRESSINQFEDKNKFIQSIKPFLTDGDSLTLSDVTFETTDTHKSNDAFYEE